MKKTICTATNRIKLAALFGVCIMTTSASFANSLDEEPQEQVLRILTEGNLVKVEQLFDTGVDINQDIAGDGTPLIIAVQNDNKALVKFLLEKGADVDRESIRDGNPLIVAALTNNVELVDYLYQQGASIDAIVEHDETALISASRAGHFKVVKYLVEHGADVNLAVNTQTLKGMELRSPLNGAKTNQIRQYLLANGATD